MTNKYFVFVPAGFPLPVEVVAEEVLTAPRLPLVV
jgi:hypothetical protein